MGCLGDLLSNAAGAVGETARIGWTSGYEEKNMTPALTEKVNRLMGRTEYGDLDVLDTLANAYMDGTTLQYDSDLTCELWTKAANADPCGINVQPRNSLQQGPIQAVLQL